MDNVLVQMEGIDKRFPGVHALDNCRFELRAAEVHALCGENGAGKSTMMKILSGIYPKDAGRILYKGREVEIDSPKAAQLLGISIIHQELNLMPHLTVAQNIFIGREPRKGLRFLLDDKAINEQTSKLFESMHLKLDPRTRVSDLSVAKQQMVEIAKALSSHSRLVILDEPTSSLPLAETEKLLEVIAGLRRDGIAVVFISHRLNEVVEACDRVIVLRDGHQVGTLEGGAITHDTMVKLMVGRDLKVSYAPPANARSTVALAAKNLRTGTYPFQDVHVELHRSEILGLAGLVGAGRTELARTLFGIDQPESGSIELDGRTVRFAASADAVKAGVFLVPEDRKGAGILLDLPISENISLPNLAAYRRGLTVSADAERKRAELSRTELDIRAPNVGVRTGSLSGGNQQKVVLAKWLAMDPKVIIFDEPTRGIDVGAKSEIYRLMRGLADAGVAVLMISSDMEEVIGVSDRVAVMHEGRIAGILERAQCSEENILRLAVGKTL